MGEMIRGGIFQEYISDLIRKPIIAAGGLIIALKIGLTITKTINHAKSITDANQLEVMAMYVQIISYILALLPFAMARPRIFSIFLKIMKRAHRFFMKDGLVKGVVLVLITICDKVLHKISSNFMVMLIMVIIVIPISSLGLVISKAVTSSVIERQKESEKAEGGIIKKIINTFAADPSDVFNAFKRILRNVSKSSIESFPMLGTILGWITTIVNKLKSLGTTIGNTIKNKILSAKSDEKGELQENNIVKFSLMGLIGSLLVMILKKSPIGGILGLFVIIASKLGKNITDKLNKGILGKLINMFKSIGANIAKRFGITELLTKGKTVTKTLKTMDTVNDSLKEIK